MANIVKLSSARLAPAAVDNRAGRPGPRQGQLPGKIGILLTAPALLALTLTGLYPMVSTLLMSFRATGMAGDGAAFVGFRNYARMLADPAFRNALADTVGFVAAGFVFEALVAMPVALALNRGLRGTAVLRAVVALPLMVAPVVAAMSWRFMFANGYGVINGLLADIGVDGPSWLSTPWLARFSILVPILWLALPFDILVLLAGLAGISSDVIEAAEIDGSNAWQRFVHIVLPLLRPVILIILVIRMADAFRIFDVVFVLTGSGPANSTDVLSTMIYRQMFTKLDFSGGAAGAVILVVLTAGCAALAFFTLRQRTNS